METLEIVLVMLMALSLGFAGGALFALHILEGGNDADN